MQSIPQARGQVCPVCALGPSSNVEHHSGSLVVLNLLCPAGHIWQTKWTEVT